MSSTTESTSKPNVSEPQTVRAKPKWDKPIQFLMSCIATSVGLGNVWRFPFVAYQNGGGAFLIPYIIVLLFIGKPMYYLETVLGQFSCCNCIRLWHLSPAMKGTGVIQVTSAGLVLSYYVSIVSLCIYYLAMSFNSKLPWGICQSGKGWEDCIPSGEPRPTIWEGRKGSSSAELYFKIVVLRQKSEIDSGIGAPIWDLSLCLLASWLMIYLIVSRGVRSTGKASYFLALFPYVILIILLIRAVTLPGAGKGIMFFLTPEWSSVFKLKVWYAAVTQVFFSLSVCSGALIMFASYNNFSQNVYRDSMIVTTLDTVTSLISGITIFGILGNLAEQLGITDISEVLGSGGTGLAFVSYPDAIAQSPLFPQLFAVLFFLMMTVLGVGSGVALLSIINAVIIDALPKTSIRKISALTCVVGFLVGLVYETPGGQYILELVDFYGGTFMRLFAAILEIIGVMWIYGLENLALDLEFMLGKRPSCYFRCCWGVVTPLMMIIVFAYAMITSEKLLFAKKYVYPYLAYFAGHTLQFLGIIMLPLFFGIAMYRNRTTTVIGTVKAALRRREDYGPTDPDRHKAWHDFHYKCKADRKLLHKNWFQHIKLSLFGGYRKGKPEQAK